MMMGMHMQNEVEKPGLRFGINPHGRFVQNEQIRMIDQRTGQEYTLLLTAGQLTNSFLSNILNPHYLKGVLTLALLRFGHSADQILIVVQAGQHDFTDRCREQGVESIFCGT